MTIRPNTGSTNPATADVGEIYVTDVGWYEYEELNVIKEPASNCGWPYYDGFGIQTEFAGLNSNLNQDEPNPLYGISGCTQQYFTFRNLLKQATADNIHTVYNPCNASVPISGGNDNRFFHHLPVFDWVHGFDSTRVAVFTTNNFSIKQVGTIASGVTGIPFSGTAAVAGCWYTGTKFPPQYTDTYFLSDYGAGWIKNITIQYTDQLQKVADFASAFGAIIHMSQDPLDSSLFATDYTNESIKRITYGGNQAPIVKMSSDKTYGPGPLSVNFTGSNSYDPDGPSVTYSWNFGDASALNTSANPSHTFTPGNSLPKKYVVKLTVKDNLNVPTIDSMIVSANNTPPNVAITSPVNNSFYQLGSDTAYSLKATVTDAEHHSNELSYAWQAILRHNTHQHPEPIDTNKITSELISRIGCNGETFYWFIKLTVTDAAGLSKVDSAKLLPQCGGPLPLSLISFSVSSHSGSNNVTWTTSNEVNLKIFEIERSYDGTNFIKIGTVNANTIQGVNNYNYKDDNFLDGYIYYRLKMIDIDGNFSRSFIVRVYSGTNSSNELTISPNPFHNEFLVGASFAQTGKITLRIVDVTGKVIRTIKKQVNAGFNSFQINKLENLSKGIYFLEVIQDNDTRKAKLIKEN